MSYDDKSYGNDNDDNKDGNKGCLLLVATLGITFLIFKVFDFTGGYNFLILAFVVLVILVNYLKNK